MRYSSFFERSQVSKNSQVSSKLAAAKTVKLKKILLRRIFLSPIIFALVRL